MEKFTVVATFSTKETLHQTTTKMYTHAWAVVYEGRRVYDSGFASSIKAANSSATASRNALTLRSLTHSRYQSDKNYIRNFEVEHGKGSFEKQVLAREARNTIEIVKVTAAA